MYGEIKRSASVIMMEKDRHGKVIRIGDEDLMAEAMEHEIDHLDGRLYIDHVESPDRLHMIEPGTVSKLNTIEMNTDMEGNSGKV